MNAVYAAALMRECMMVVVKISLPVLGISLVIGLIVSFIQAVTQINEATLAFLPKLAAIGLALIVLGPFMASTLADFSLRMFDQIVAMGSS